MPPTASSACAGTSTTSAAATCKRLKPTAHTHEEKDDDHTDDRTDYHQPLLPGLPDHLAHLCLSHLPAALLHSVSRSWRRLLSSPTFPNPPLSLYALLSTTSSSLDIQSFDPITSTWTPLPEPPLPPHLLLRHPSFLSRRLPIQSLSIAGSELALIAATADPSRLLPAFSHPLIFDPRARLWRAGSPFPCPRRWCAAASEGGRIYLTSGVAGPDYDPKVARSAERLDLTAGGGSNGAWEPLPPLPDGRFCREAVDGLAAKGEIYFVNNKGSWCREGVVYDAGSEKWEAMPAGMVAGWAGPAAAAEDGEIYAVEAEKGAVWRYDWERDRWTEVMASEKLRGAAQVAARGGRVCAVVDGGAAVAVADVVGKRVWVVEPPEGRRVLAVHVLPRMSNEES